MLVPCPRFLPSGSGNGRHSTGGRSGYGASGSSCACLLRFRWATTVPGDLSTVGLSRRRGCCCCQSARWCSGSFPTVPPILCCLFAAFRHSSSALQCPVHQQRCPHSLTVSCVGCQPSRSVRCSPARAGGFFPVRPRRDSGCLGSPVSVDTGACANRQSMPGSHPTSPDRLRSRCGACRYVHCPLSYISILLKDSRPAIGAAIFSM